MSLLILIFQPQHGEAQPKCQSRERCHGCHYRQSQGGVTPPRYAQKEKQHLKRGANHKDDAGDLRSVHEALPLSMAWRSSGGKRFGIESVIG